MMDNNFSNKSENGPKFANNHNTEEDRKPPDKQKENAASAGNRDSIINKSPEKQSDFKHSSITGKNLVELRTSLGHGDAIYQPSEFAHFRFCWLEAIAHDRRISSGAVKLAICINGSFNGITAQCYKSVASIAKELGVSIETIRRSLRALEAAGYLHTISRAGNHRQNIYYPDFRLTTPHKKEGTLPTIPGDAPPQSRGRNSKRYPNKNPKVKSYESERSSTEDFMQYVDNRRKEL